MIFKRKTKQEIYNNKTTWKRYYAWHPVFWDGGWAWFEWVETKQDSTGTGFDEFYSIYRPIQKVKEN